MTNLKDLVDIVRQSRERTADVFPLPIIDDCIDFAITEAAEYIDAKKRENPIYKRNNSKEHSPRKELGQCGYMVASALMQMDKSMSMQTYYEEGSVHEAIYWLCLYRMEFDGGCVVDALGNYVLVCESNGWEPAELLRETCTAFETKHLSFAQRKPLYPVLTAEEAAAQGGR